MAKESMYWADQIARKIIKDQGNLKEYNIEGGVSPSARKHIGSVREMMTADLVRKSLEDMGKKVNLYYSWDSFDRLKKVAASIPKEKREELKKYIGVPTGLIPDPFGCHDNYAEHFQGILEEEVEAFNIFPKWLYEYKIYKKLTYWREIRTILRNREKIRKIINKYRTNPLTKKWWPVTVFCEKCNNGDYTYIISYDENTTITYNCDCGYNGKMDFSKMGMIKPTWRADWAMRWAYYNINFEPSGKDHMVSGSSYWTSSDICREVFNKEPPYGIIYEFVGKKGLSGKMSASSGDIITATEVLSIYSQQVARWFFAGTKPQKPFVFPFDEDIFKAYEDFYRTERIYYGKEKVNARDKAHWSRVYEMSLTSKPAKTMPIQPNFKHCVEMINICITPEKALARVIQLENLKNKTDINRYRSLLVRAKNWLDNYASDKYKFEVQEDPTPIKLDENQRKAIFTLATDLKKPYSEEELFTKFYEIINNIKLTPQNFFQPIYQILINRYKGPRLAPFILAVGKDKVAKILKNAIK